jgi:hypothetical protein
MGFFRQPQTAQQRLGQGPLPADATLLEVLLPVFALALALALGLFMSSTRSGQQQTTTSPPGPDDNEDFNKMPPKPNHKWPKRFGVRLSARPQESFLISQFRMANCRGKMGTE